MPRSPSIIPKAAAETPGIQRSRASTDRKGRPTEGVPLLSVFSKAVISARLQIDDLNFAREQAETMIGARVTRIGAMPHFRSTKNRPKTYRADQHKRNQTAEEPPMG